MGQECVFCGESFKGLSVDPRQPGATKAQDGSVMVVTLLNDGLRSRDEHVEFRKAGHLELREIAKFPTEDNQSDLQDLAVNRKRKAQMTGASPSRGYFYQPLVSRTQAARDPGLQPAWSSCSRVLPGQGLRASGYPALPGPSLGPAPVTRA